MITAKVITFGEHLRMLRDYVALTLKQVANSVLKDVSLLAKIERNKRQPTKQHIN